MSMFGKEGYIHHTVAFKLKWEKGSGEEQKFFEDSLRILNSVPKVKNFSINKQININNPFDYELSMDFENQNDFDEYIAHLAHQDYVKSIWLKQVDEFLEKDTVVFMR